MKKCVISVCISLILAGCTSSIGVMATSRDGEYVSVARNMAGPFSSLELAQQEAINNAIDHCKKMGLSYKKLYAIDRPMAVAQAPESSLYFTCISLDAKAQTQDPSTTATPDKSKANLAPSQMKNALPSVSDGYTLEMQALISVLEKKGILMKEDVTEELRTLNIK
jgi:hypothetical protein